MKIIGYGKATYEDIIKYEKETGFCFPEDYKNFLLEYNGGEPEVKKNHILFDGIKQQIRIFNFFGITKMGKAELDDNNLFFMADEFKDLIPLECTIPIVFPYGGHCAIILSINENMLGVYVYDAKHYYKESSKKKFMHKICDSFTEFVELIVPDEE